MPNITNLSRPIVATALAFLLTPLMNTIPASAGGKSRGSKPANVGSSSPIPLDTRSSAVSANRFKAVQINREQVDLKDLCNPGQVLEPLEFEEIPNPAYRCLSPVNFENDEVSTSEKNAMKPLEFTRIPPPQALRVMPRSSKPTPLPVQTPVVRKTPRFVLLLSTPASMSESLFGTDSAPLQEILRKGIADWVGQLGNRNLLEREVSHAITFTRSCARAIGELNSINFRTKWSQIHWADIQPLLMPAWRTLQKAYPQNNAPAQRSLAWILLSNEPEDLDEFRDALKTNESWNIVIAYLQTGTMHEIPEALIQLTQEFPSVRLQFLAPTSEAIAQSLFELTF